MCCKPSQMAKRECNSDWAPGLHLYKGGFLSLEYSEGLGKLFGT